MKIFKNIYKIALILPLLFSSCIEEKFEVEKRPVVPIVVSSDIAPVVLAESPAAPDKLPPLATRSLIDAATTSHLQTQFLRIDEGEDKEGNGTYKYPTWDNGYLVEASVISSPSNQSQGYKRTVYLNPIQGYRIHVKPAVEGQAHIDTTFYHTRMLSWYPITCPLEKDDKGVAAITQFSYYQKANVGYDGYTVKDNQLQINFRNLDGATDVMVSEVREGQHWHFPGDPVKHPSDYMPGDVNMTGTSIYRQPFGSNETSPIYDNCFKYKHYLSAIKVYAYAEESAQSSEMWGRIRQVEVKNQPTSCSVKIPDLSTTERVWGSAEYSKTELGSFSLQKKHIFQGDSNADGEEIAPDNPTLDGTSSSNKLYLGYSLVAPDRDVELQVHTDAGIFDITIPKEYKVYDKDGKQVSTEIIYQEGYIYNIILNFGTDGSIAAMLLKDADGVYYDLTTGEKYGDSQNQIFKYKTANSYIVDPRTSYQDKDKNEHYYDGYVFLANVMGNGNEGLRSEFPHKSTEIKPVTAGIIWESSLGLITNVKFLYDYIRFKVQPPKQDGTFTKGNAVIGAYDEEGKILWSWHIWITDKPAIREYKIGKQDIAIMDRNLGATEADPTVNALASYGLYYQWGRKDPSMPPPTKDYRPLSTATSTYYDYYGNELTSAEVANIAKPTVFDAVNNPMFIILPTNIPEFYAYDWLNKRINTLWGSEDQNQKTIYDPCPHGYRVPGTEIRTFMSNSLDGIGTSDTGPFFKSSVADKSGNTAPLYFPLAGYKGVDRGMSSLTAAWKYVGEKGDYMYKNIHPNGHRDRIYLSKAGSWTETGAASGDDGIGSKENTYNGNIQTDFANRRTAASVRCIRDDELQFTGLVYPFIRTDEVLLLGHNKSLEYGADAKGSALNYIQFSARRSNKPKPYYTAEPSDVRGMNYMTTYILPGHNSATGEPSYPEMGEYIFKVTAKNEMGTMNSTQKTVGVINLTEIYDVKIGGKDPETSTFIGGDQQKISFKLNMREPLAHTGNVNNTTAEDYELIRKYTEVYINDVWVKADYDPSTGIFTTKDAVTLEGDLRLQCKAINSNELLKEYVMTHKKNSVVYIMGEKMRNTEDLVTNQYFAVSTTDATQRYWRHTKGSQNSSSTSPKEMQIEKKTYARNDVMNVQNVFRYNDGNIQITANDLWLGKYFGAMNPNTDWWGNVINNDSNKYKFDTENGTDGTIFIGRKSGVGSPWKIYIETKNGIEYLEWGPNGSAINSGTPWYFYKVAEVTPISYSAPVETVLP